MTNEPLRSSVKKIAFQPFLSEGIVTSFNKKKIAIRNPKDSNIYSIMADNSNIRPLSGSYHYVMLFPKCYKHLIPPGLGNKLSIVNRELSI